MLGGDFFTRWWEPEEEWFWWFEPFSKLKTAFCEYRTSIKIKISMTYVPKEYEIKTKMVQEQWLQLKVTFLLGYNLGNFSRWGGWKNFWLVGETPPITPSRENPECWSYWFHILLHLGSIRKKYFVLSFVLISSVKLKQMFRISLNFTFHFSFKTQSSL